MKQFFFVFVLLQFSGAATQGQSVYYFQYNFNKPGNNISYYTFFSLNEDGSALARVRFTNPADKQDALVEMQLEEDFTFIRPGEIDTTKILYRAINYTIKSDNGNIKLDTPLTFVFKINPVTDEGEPAGVLVPGEKDLNTATSFKAEYIDAQRLRNPSFLGLFFSEGDDFYDRLLFPKTKGLSNSEKDMKMLMVIVANITDTAIGDDCKNDMLRFEQSMTDIALKLGIAKKNIIATKIAGNNYSKKNVQDAVAGLKAKVVPKKDIVIFYYSGHGFTKPEEKKNRHRYPFIDLCRPNETNYLQCALNIEDDIFNKITPLGARLNLVIGDCCNYPVIVNKVDVKKKGKKKSLGFFASESNMRSLFLNDVSTSILACAADTGELATCHNDYGSYFSYYFKANIESFCSIFRSNSSWQQLFAETSAQTTKLARRTLCNLTNKRCVQNPIIKILPEPAKQAAPVRGF